MESEKREDLQEDNNGVIFRERKEIFYNIFPHCSIIITHAYKNKTISLRNGHQ